MSCFTLSNSSLCGATFSGFPVLTSSFANETDFDALIQSAQNPAVATFEDAVHGCADANLTALAENVAVMRYQMSFNCVILVSEALNAGCTAPTGVDGGDVVLCGNLCTIAAGTYQNVLATSGCVSTTWTQQKLLARTSACTSMTASLATNDDQHCLLGVSPELDQCGFVSAAEKTAYCASTTDQCCSFPAGVQFATLNTADGNYYLPGTTASNVLGIGAIAGIVVGVVAVVALAVGAFFLWRRRRVQAEERDKYMPKALYESSNNNNINAFRNNSPIYPPPQQLQQQQLPQQPPPGSRPYPGGSLPRPQHHLPQNMTASPAPVFTPAATATATTLAQQQTTVIAAKQAANTEIMRIIHPYDAQLEDELQLVEGDDLIVLKKFDDGWAQGLNPLTGKQGAFPLVCVISLAELDSQKAASQKKNASGGRISKRMSSIVDFVSEVSSSPTQVAKKDKKEKKGSALRVLFAYTAAQEDELDLVVGNDVLLVKSFDDGWALGMNPLTGQKGAFPLACVDQTKRASLRVSSLLSWQEE
ncbi:hypothetical protein HK100_003561 [Physocladia obscura]|uniref:SH3 domain-containing protein n=1 Tax=Physocladia obscura TaxID=109957 RepID=A0AAD5XL57_9FUNG|nr:hypothetical protein HK100_003561 [Physocladia obscura]